jgi:hypothetical protein
MVMRPCMHSLGEKSKGSLFGTKIMKGEELKYFKQWVKITQKTKGKIKKRV